MTITTVGIDLGLHAGTAEISGAINFSVRWPVRKSTVNRTAKIAVWSEKSLFATYHMAGTDKFSLTAP
ncbi:TPA: hypothetical protein KC497_005228 [Escherichia coli O146]|nr:hypothetical protein [Escherichia coli O146]